MIPSIFLGESSMIAGQVSSGLLAMRSPVDGVGTEAAFKYITKIVVRESALYVFDYDTLRKYDYSTKVRVTCCVAVKIKSVADAEIISNYGCKHDENNRSSSEYGTICMTFLFLMFLYYKIWLENQIMWNYDTVVL